MSNFRQMTQPIATPKETLQKKYSSAVSNLLVVLGFTVLNIVLLFTKSYTYFLFSAYIPYFITDLGMYVCGKYPAEVYGADYSEMLFLNDSVFITAVVIAAVIIVLYLLSWIFARKGKVGWLIFALVFFAIDFVVLLALNGISFEIIVDILFHVWVIVILSGGIKAYYSLKKLPAEEENPLIINGEPAEITDNNPIIDEAQATEETDSKENI